jgi:hypothetical protein
VIRAPACGEEPPAATAHAAKEAGLRGIKTWRTGLSALTMAALVVAAMVLTVTRAGAADHADAPGVQGDPQADITDIYAFRSPSNPDDLVAVLNVNPLTAPTENGSTRFADDVAYQLHVDNTGDLVTDATVSVTFWNNGKNFMVEGLGNPITGDTSGAGAPAIVDAGGIKVFAGLRDDPFFFDLVGFNNFVAGPFIPANGLRPAGETPSDTLAGTNVSSIVLELPITALTGAATSDTGSIKVWASTVRDGQQVDRMAIPAINTALIPSAMKDAFNAGTPASDAMAFQAAGEATTQGLRDAVDTVFGAQDGGPLGDLTSGQVAGALIPDIVTIDFSQPVAFPNGRRLQDDVIDAALGIVLNRGGAGGISDAVDANDRAFSNSFPYLASPWVAQGAGGFEGGISPGLNLTVYGGGSLEQLQDDAVVQGGAVIAVTVNGQLVTWVIGAPSFVNDAFAGFFAAGVPANTPVLLVVG